MHFDRGVVLVARDAEVHRPPPHVSVGRDALYREYISFTAKHPLTSFRRLAHLFLRLHPDFDLVFHSDVAGNNKAET